jgi:hypothetical protein
MWVKACSGGVTGAVSIRLVVGRAVDRLFGVVSTTRSPPRLVSYHASHREEGWPRDMGASCASLKMACVVI